MRILYGICGIGMGHATRALVSIQHLRLRKHDVLVCATGAGYDFLKRRHPRVLETLGLELRTRDGELDLGEMLRDSVKALPALLVQNSQAWQAAERFSPQAVITDHDAFAGLFARSHGLSLTSIDNSQIVLRCAHPENVIGPYRAGLETLATRIRQKIPECDQYVITTFFFPPVREEEQSRTSLVPPILRESVVRRASIPPPAGHALVYASLSATQEDPALLGALASLPRQRFVVYGFDGALPLPPNCTRRLLDEEAFVRDLASATAVVSNAGMSLIGEALALGKPLYMSPIRGQYEQVLNAAYLESLGYGTASARFEAHTLGMFLANASVYAARIRETPQHDQNQRLYQTLDRLFN